MAAPLDDAASAVAPPVVAVVVTHDAGPWLEEGLGALGASDYPDLSILVIDAASAEDPTNRIAAVLPSAYVRRLDHNPGFGAAANDVLEIVEGASHFVFLHDDAAPAPDAIRLLVEEAYRSNAGVVAPKLVAWDDPRLLRAVGMAADKTGSASPYGRGELDQEQHDAVRDVFAAPGGCMLVRADLFETLGGFDPAMPMFGEDLDLCWRAQVAGARVVVAPAAVVRHLEATASELRPLDVEPPDIDRLRLRHRVRVVLKTYGFATRVRVVPQLLAVMMVEALFGGREGWRAFVDAWRWNMRDTRRDLRAARRETQRHRLVRDRDVRLLQTRASRLTAAVRSGLEAEERTLGVAAASRDLAGQVTRGGVRLTVATWTSIALLLVVGSRHLIGGHIPAVGQFAPFSHSPFTLLRAFVSGWRTTGLGSESPAPFPFALLGLGGLFTVGGMGVLQKIVVVGALPAGVVGAHRLSAPLGLWRSRLLAAVLYAAVPLPYDAIARGRWAGLIAYAAAPWLLARLLRATGIAPFGDGDQRAFREHAVPAAITLALVAALAPPVAPALVVTGFGLVLGSLLLAGPARGTLRALGLAATATAGAAVLLVPWVLELVAPGSPWSGVFGNGPPASSAPSFAGLLRLHAGPMTAGWLSLGLLVAAALPLAVGRSWRFEWAARLWATAVFACAVAWVAGRGWFGVPPPSVDVLLAPAAAALVLAAALGLAAFEMDLRDYHFGSRQLVSVAAALGAVLALVPTLVAAADGRWGAPARDYRRLLAWMPDQARPAKDFRVLWIGAPDVLPTDGWRLSSGLAYATARNGVPDVTDLWPGSDQGATGLLSDALAVARDGKTTRLGGLLASLGVRYIAVPLEAAPSGQGATKRVPPPGLLDALRAQVDLRLIRTDDAIVLFENGAWTPVRLGTRTRAPVRAGEVLVSEAYSPRWHLRVAGRAAPHHRAKGWANGFRVARAGEGTLAFRPSPLGIAALLLELALWIAAVRAAVVAFRRRRRAVDVAVVDMAVLA